MNQNKKRYLASQSQRFYQQSRSSAKAITRSKSFKHGVKIIKIWFILFCAFLALFMSSLFMPFNVKATQSDTMHYLESNNQFTVFTQIIKMTGFGAEIENSTIFAPSNTAFERLDINVKKLIQDENKEILSALISNHFLKDKKTGLELVKSKSVKTKAGKVLDLTVTSTKILINKSVNVSKLDIILEDGIIHLVDDVIVG
jgi:uncharacterized surface protein with fasciclin (FAS1) repeats